MHLVVVMLFAIQNTTKKTNSRTGRKIFSYGPCGFNQCISQCLIIAYKKIKKNKIPTLNCCCHIKQCINELLEIVFTLFQCWKFKSRDTNLETSLQNYRIE